MRKGTPWGLPRLATHGWVLLLALLVLGLAPLQIDHSVVQTASAADASVGGLRVPLETTIEERVVPTSTSVAAGQLPALAAYQVKRGDTLTGIAAQSGVSTNTLAQVNQLPSTSVTPGQRLLVPPVNGLLVPIDPNQSLDLLAGTFRVDPDVLRRLNGLGRGSKLPRELFVPEVSTGPASPAMAPSDPATGHERVVRFIWPTQGVLTQGFWQYHPGIDIANAVGTPEYAADSGTVTWAGWGDYGIYVQIDHRNGFVTVYGHLSQVLVSQGQVVSKGELIGLMGATGRATGPHLHFEVRFNGVPQNPLDLLP